MLCFGMLGIFVLAVDSKGFWKKSKKIFCVLHWIYDARMFLISLFTKLGKIIFFCLFLPKMITAEMSSAVSNCSSHSVAAE